MNEMIQRVATAMKKRVKLPLGNITSLEPVLVGSLGDAWPHIALAAIEAMRKPDDMHPEQWCNMIDVAARWNK